MYVCDIIFNNVTNKGSEVQKSQVTRESHKKGQVGKAGIVKSRVGKGSKVCDDSSDQGQEPGHLLPCVPVAWSAAGRPGSRSRGMDSSAGLVVLGKSSNLYQKSTG